MKIVFLDAKSIGEDIPLDRFGDFGELILHDHTKDSEVPERVRDADVIVINKTPINETTIGAAEHLKLVCITATGTNNLDKAYLDSRGIAWRNVAGYSTESVAQHTFALLFFLLEKLSYYDAYVKEEKYVNDVSFTHFEKHFHQISGMKWGIIGLGNIGKRVYDIAKLFGCEMSYYSTSGKNDSPGYHRVDLDTLLAESDIVSVHAPLNEDTKGLMNAETFKKMKKSAIFINVGRGPIVDEQALYDALVNEEIGAAGLDVLSEEPMSPDNPLIRFKDSTRLIITPHIAWASVEARANLMDIIYGQIRDFFSNKTGDGSLS
ncbi:MAG: D-2-hydroxyacid dehydrogenase [Lachnospiraceae bacterium]|nr:D-2-hydroxyacid dehydrogenase [Lachnospiraceae bacterium]